MPVVRISGPDDPRVEAYRSVTDSDLIRARGLFVAEGRLVVERLIAEGRYDIRSLLLSETARRALEPALGALEPSVPIYVCEAADFRGIAGYDVHRGCLALSSRPSPPVIDDLLATARLVVVLEGVTNADNVGGVFRNAAAFDVDAVLLDAASCDPLYRKAIRTSMAAALHVPFARLTNHADEWPAALAGLKARGFTIAAFTPAAAGRDLDELAASLDSLRLALLFGSEGPGLGAASEAAADHRVCIPTNPRVDSLNLAVAAGIALHRLSRVR
jgi:tRNA G18 (ribose-2'-O)-methylase SpoU